LRLVLNGKSLFSWGTVSSFWVSGQMNVIERKMDCVTKIKGFYIGLPLLIALLIGGCGQQDRTGSGADDLAPTIDLGATIGSLIKTLPPEPIPVAGYGLVSGLKGTGSAECPPQVRDYLKQYILKQLPANKGLDVEKFINSPDTAVVLVEGIIPPIPSKNEYFDVRVTAFPNTQTTSLEGGRLFVTDLKIAGSFGKSTRNLADVEGPIFIDKISSSKVDKRLGYILAGGKVLDEYKLVLELTKPDFTTTNSIRNRLNGRFGRATARAIVPGRIELSVPDKYREQKQRFISIVKAMYIAQRPEVIEERINTFVRRLAGSEDKYASEVALEAIGNKCLGKLSVLLRLSNNQVRFHAARCMLNLGSDDGFLALREIALDKNSAYRFEALESITIAANRSDTAMISRKLLRDDDFDIRLAACEQLRKLDDITIEQEPIARSFYLERITQTEYKTIFVSRSGQPRIVILGSPINCNRNIFLQSADGDITINSPADQEYVTIIRKHPKRSSVIAKLNSSFEVGDIIRTLCEEPLKEEEKGSGGLGASYADMIALLKQMCDVGVIRAEFRAGPLPKIGLIIKK